MVGHDLPARKVVKHPLFDAFFALVVFLNAIFTGLEYVPLLLRASNRLKTLLQWCAKQVLKWSPASATTAYSPWKLSESLAAMVSN